MKSHPAKRCLATLALVSMLTAPVVVTAASVDEYLAEAKEFVQKGEIKAAVIQLKNALQEDPTNVQARVMLGSLYLRGGDGPAAAKEFGRARDLGAAEKLWLPGYARALMLQGQFDAVLKEVTAEGDLDNKQRAELIALRGNANLATGQIEEAQGEYDKALALDRGNPMARLGKAQILLSQRQEEQALEQLNKVLLEHPAHVESRLARGDLMRRLRRLDDALVDYKRAIDESPRNARAYIGQALVHIAQRDVDNAKKDLEVLHTIAADLPAVNYLQALVSFQEGDYDRASDELQALLRVTPSSLQAQLMYGVVSYARNEFTIADEYLSRVLSSNPNNPQIAKLVGAARIKLRDPQRAVKALAPVVSEATRDAQLLALLGTAYLQTGENSKGAALIERAVELDPEQAMLRTQLAVGKIASGDTAAAIDQLESAVALGQDVVQADVLLVLSYLNKKEFDKAIAASEGLEERMSDSPIPFNLTGLAYLAQSNFTEAKQRFERALEKDPKFLVAHMNLARLGLLTNDPGAAKKAYEDVLAKDAKHIGAMMGLAALAQSANDAEQAEAWLRRANDANPQALQPKVVLAELYLRRNEGLKATNLLSGLPAEQAELPAVLRLRGMAQLQSGDYSSAIHTLRTLTEQQPKSMEAWFQLARAQAASNDLAAARESFAKATELDPEYKVPVVWVGLGELELRDRRYDAALELAQTLKEKFPQRVFGYDLEAAAYRGQGNTERATEALEAAIAIEGDTRRVNLLASAYVATGDNDKAVEVLQDWLDKHPTDGATWANLGVFQQQVGDTTGALLAYENAIKHGQANSVILNNMAWLYLQKRDKRAEEYATRAYQMASDSPEIIDTYGWVLFQTGKRNDGLAALQQALVIAPNNAEIALHVAEALHALNRDAEARPVLERILREHAGSAIEKDARALLGKLRG
ncbi:XrtA/PEP-CTERM system TPR-repeat protein PrsT [Thiosocius teredinicola]|uniref:XrtA/PEP-CTERM system TPR-repeat protein PrsT n=1 Tax=Thiosocius teredinicola TaxID=1973002 RepID=UPI00099117CE